MILRAFTQQIREFLTILRVGQIWTKIFQISHSAAGKQNDAQGA